MVRINVFFLFLLFLFGEKQILVAKDPVFFIQIQQAVANKPIEGNIKIVTEKDAIINSKSFKVANILLNVEKISEIVQGEEKVTNWKFFLEEKNKGLYLLPSISVEIDGKRFFSPEISYEVKEGKTQAFDLLMDAFIIGPKKIYPGQRLSVGYRISFSKPVQLTKEILPLLDLSIPYFKKIGDPVVEQVQKKLVSEHIISQEVKALSPGKISLSDSIVEGFVYEIDQKGNQKKLFPVRSKVEKMEIIIYPFPEQSMPTSFDGAIGQFEISSKVLSPTYEKLEKVKGRLGDRLKLEIEIFGSGDFDTVKPPLLKCQPGFSGFFNIDPLPLSESQDGFKKTYVYEIYPLTDLIEQIPSIAFSSFDPYTETYKTSFTEPIELEIEKEKAVVLPLPFSIDRSFKKFFNLLSKTKKIEFYQENFTKEKQLYLAEKTVFNTMIFSSKIFWLMPFFALFLFIEKKLINYWKKHRKSSQLLKSKKLLKKAYEQRINPKACSALIIEALLKLLEEKKDLSFKEEVVSYIRKLEDDVFSDQKKSIDSEEMLNQASVFIRRAS